MDLRNQNRNHPSMNMMIAGGKANGNHATYLYFIFKILGLLVPALAIYLGYELFLLGVTGKASIVVNAKDINGQLINAAPGLFFAVGGIVALIVAIMKSVKYSA
jgi:hypothetical protein